MEEIAYLWSNQENVEDLKQKLLCMSIELEQLEIQSVEENRKNKEYINQLIQLFELACKERDEAKDQLHNLINKIMPSSDLITGFSPVFNPIINTSTSINESNSFFDDSFLDVVLSPDFFSKVDFSFPNDFINSEVDQASLLIDNIVQGKKLPEKGNLLKAVLDAGPLLQNVLAAGPLPRWRNPRPPMTVVNQTVQFPPVSIKGYDSRPYAEMLCSSSQSFSNRAVNFGNGGYSSCLGGDKMLVPNTNKANRFVSLGKRQRLC